MQTLSKPLMLALTLACAPVFAHEGAHVHDAWVRATVPQQQATGAFMELNASIDSKLVRATSPVSDHVELHEMTMQDNVMKMREVPSIALPKGKTVDLKPGGYHIMLLDLKQQIHAGDKVPLTLTFEHANGKEEVITVQAPAHPLGEKPAASGEHDHDHGHDHGHGNGHGEHQQ